MIEFVPDQKPGSQREVEFHLGEVTTSFWLQKQFYSHTLHNHMLNQLHPQKLPVMPNLQNRQDKENMN